MPKPWDKFDPERMADVIREEDGVIKDAAQEIGCSERTIHRYRHKHDCVEEAVQESRPALVGEMREKVKDVARNDLPGQEVTPRLQYDSALKLLTVFDEDVDWADRKRTDLTSGGEPVSSIQLQVVETDPDTFEQERRQG